MKKYFNLHEEQHVYRKNDKEYTQIIQKTAVFCIYDLM